MEHFTVKEAKMMEKQRKEEEMHKKAKAQIAAEKRRDKKNVQSK